MTLDPRRRRIDDEVRHHLAELQAQLEAQGLSPEDARSEARRRFGDPGRVARATRKAGGGRGDSQLAGIGQDVVHAIRGLRRAPSFTLSVTLTLALALGATLTVVSVAWSVLVRPLDLRDPDGLVVLVERMPEQGIEGAQVSAGTYQDWRTELTTVEELGGWEWVSRTLEDPDRPEEMAAVQVTGNLLEILGIRPVLGRALAPRDERPGGTATTVMISHDLWQRRFGGAGDVVGRILPVDGVGREVVGVLPPHLEIFGSEPDLVEPDPLLPANPTNRGVRTLRVVARLPSGGSVAPVEQEVATLTERIAEEYPTSARGWSASALPVAEYMVGEIRPRVLAASVAVLLLLLAATVNVANLMLVRAADGERELGVRAAMGAGRSRLVRARLIEGLLLGVTGAAGGLGLAFLLRGWLASGFGSILPRSLEAGGVTPMVAAAAALAVLIGIAVALGPALGSAERALSSLGRVSASTSPVRSRYRNALIVSQLGLTTVILVGAGLLVRTAMAIQDVDVGFDTEDVVAARIAVDPVRYETDEAEAAYFDALLSEVRGLPSVASAGLTSALPMDPVSANFDLPTRHDPGTPWGEAPQVDFRIVTPGLAESLGLRVVEGRAFDQADRSGPLVAVVNRSLAESFWPGEPAVGKRIQNVWRQDDFAEVVGVVEDTRFYGPMEASRPEMFMLHDHASWSFMTVVARGRAGATALARDLEGAVTAVDPLLPPQEVFRVETLVRDATLRERFVSLLLGGFAVLALILVGGGVYGVIAYAVRTRRREIGVRLALGATRSEVSWKVLRNGLLLGVVGTGVGLMAAVPATGLVSGILFGVQPLDPVTLAAVPALLLTVAGLASLAPALRASRLDPNRLLREE